MRQPGPAPDRRRSGSSTAMTGSSTTVAPRPCNRSTSSDAWARVRVTTTLRPASGGRRHPDPRPPVSRAEVHAGHRADHDDRRGRKLDRGQAGQGRPHHLLSGRGPPVHDGHRCVGVSAAAHQGGGDPGPLGHAHEDHQRPPGPAQGRPVDATGGGGVPDVAGDHGDRGGQAPMGHRDAGRGRSGEGRAHPGHHLVRHTGPIERLGLLAAPSEQERVAALQPDHVLAGPAVLDELGVDLGLAVRRPRRLAHVDEAAPAGPARAARGSRAGRG